MQYKRVVFSVQCLVCSMKCTGAGEGAGADAGALCSVHCAVCSLQFAAGTGENLEVAPPGGRMSVCVSSSVLPGALPYKFSSILS